MRITPSIYIVGGTLYGLTDGYDCVIYLVRGPAGLFFVVVGIVYVTETLLANIEAEGFDTNDIGDILIIEDHINMMGVNPLIGPNNEELGPRFPDMCEPYDRALIKKSETAALNQGIKAHRGVYVGVSGPNLETRAEYRFLRTIGADVVGMSTIPEVLVGVHAGLRVLGFSVITDRCLPDALKPAKIEEIIAVANESEPRLSGIVKEVISGIDG